MPFYIKDPSLASQLEVELQQIAVILPDVYLAGESLTADVNNVYHFNFCIFHPYLDPIDASQSALSQMQYYEDTIRNFEKNQTTPLGKIGFQPDVYLQSKGTINGGKLNNANIDVSWLNMEPQDTMLCSAQYLYCFKSKTKIWNSSEFYNLFNKKILHSSAWPNLFYYLSFASRTNTDSMPLTVYVKDTINFLFIMYIKHLAKGWQLDRRDKGILETYFANNDWKTYLYQSFQQEATNQNNNDIFDLIKALKLSVNTQSLKTNTDNNATLANLITPPANDENKSQLNLVQNQKQDMTKEEEENQQPLHLLQNHNQARKETQKTIEVVYTSVPYRNSHGNEEKAFEAIQKRFQNNLKLSEAIKTQINFHRQDPRLETEDEKRDSSLKIAHKNFAYAAKKKKTTNKILQRRPIHHQENTLVRKTTDEQTNKTVWNTIKALIQWAYEHPMYAFTALFSIIVIMQIRPTRSNAEEKGNICFEYFDPIGGNSNFNDAKVLVILNNNSYDSHIDVPTAGCLNFYKAKTLLQQNVPFGHKTNCGGNECIGWDSISTERTLQEKKYLFERVAFNNINKIYNEHAQKRGLFDLQHLLRNYLTFLKKEKLSEETEHGFSEESIKTTIDLKRIKNQDGYRGTITMIKHVEFFVDKEIRPPQDIEDLHKQYQEQFFPIKEPQSDNDLKIRTETMYRAFNKYISPKNKLAILADEEVYNNYVKKGFHKDLGSHMILSVKKNK